jgi:hypothetical protein
MFDRILGHGERILAAVQHSFSPPRTATSREVRVNGALCLLAAFLVLIATGLVFYAMLAFLPSRTQGIMAVVLAPALVFYALSLFGGYRLLVGKSPEPAYPGEMSFKRIAYGIASVLMMCTLVLGLAAIADCFLQ